MHLRLTLAALLALSALAPAQAGNNPEQLVPFSYDSGWLTNPAPNETVVASHTIRIANATWIRLQFQAARLWNGGDEDSGTYLRITSHRDGAVQELRTRHVREWGLSSAYFNGDAVQVDIVAPAGAGPSRLVLRNVWIGPILASTMSQCGSTDDRVPSSDPRLARTLPVTCTSWMFDDCTHCLTTAGHCYADPAWITVVEFNVPPSTSFGTVNHPGPEHQYAVDPASRQFQSGGVGNDWSVFGCFPNSNTGLTPVQAQGGGFFRLVAPPAVSPSVQLEVKGYGSDSNDPTYSFWQQAHTGDYVLYSGTTIRHTADTTGGNSGSPVIWNASAPDAVVGLHTHGACSTTVPIGSNSGTASTQANWTAARANPLGVCAPVSSAQVYCVPKLNSLGCAPTISSTGAASATAGAGSFTITAGNLLNQKTGLLFYGYLPASAPFMGGTRCVEFPLRRTPVQATGGNTSGSSCTGSLSHDMGARITAGVDSNLALGSIAYAQVWSRDPGDALGASLTAGLRFTIGP